MDGARQPGFPLAHAAAPLLEVARSAASTNAALAEAERRAPQSHATALATLDQTAGRGRRDRAWVAPPGSALAASVVLRPGVPAAALGWLPLIGGLAARDAVAAELLPAAGTATGAGAAAEAGDGLRSERGARVSVKWPNDVLVARDGAERKIAGVLAELVPETSAVILGVGVNTAMTAAQLPVPTATSIAVERPDAAADPLALADRVLAALLSGILARVDALQAAGGDAVAAGIAAEAARRCGTIGREVRVELPGGGSLRGLATGLDADGALLLRDEEGATPAVHAGDVTHLRYE